jgi:hypothetical protein
LPRSRYRCLAATNCQMVSVAFSAVDGAGMLPTRCARGSECVTATDAPAEYHGQGSDEAHGECPKVSRSHVAIVAVVSNFDK